MTRDEKLMFINSIPFKLAMTDHRGCKPDWFTITYYKYKDYVSRNGNPKYIKISNDGAPWDVIFMLTNEDDNSCRYWMNGSSFIICDSSTIKSELLWLNGQKNTSLGKLTYEESTEDDLIDWMYGIASMYYIRDIQPIEQERLKEQEKKEFKSSFAKNFFKL